MDWEYFPECFHCLGYHVGYVVSTSSTDFPHVIFCALNEPLYLFPKSLYFMEGRPDMTKAQKAKCDHSLISGEQIHFLASKNHIVVSFHKSSKINDKKVRYADSKVAMEDLVVVSPGYPRKCWSSWLRCCLRMGPNTNLMNAIPNIVYNAYVTMDAYITEPQEGSDIPQPHIYIELKELVKPSASHSDIVYKAEWNLPDRRGLFEGLTEWTGSNEVVRERKIVRPKPPQDQELNVILYIMDNRELVWPRKPYYKVVMGVLPTENERKFLIEGRSVKADMFYCKFNKFYVVHRYGVIREGTIGNQHFPFLLTRKSLGTEFGGHTEYYVQLTFSQFPGYYVCENFKRCLIDDPKLLLFDAQFSSNVNYPAWVRLNEFGQPARFSVSSLTGLQVLPSSEIIIFEGEGLVANACTGSVFCLKFPNIRFLLQYPDRPDVETGEYINFRAMYLRSESTFVIVNWESQKCRFPVPVISCNRGFLFGEKITCGRVKACQNLYEGSRLGLISDLEEIIISKARAENTNIPETAWVYVIENESRNRPTFFNIYCLYTTNTKELLQMVEEPPHSIPAKLWWENIDQWKELKTICAEIYNIKVDNENAEEFSADICDLVEELRELI